MYTNDVRSLSIGVKKTRVWTKNIKCIPKFAQRSLVTQINELLFMSLEMIVQHDLLLGSVHISTKTFGITEIRNLEVQNVGNIPNYYVY